jgi:hypothetical protein
MLAGCLDPWKAREARARKGRGERLQSKRECWRRKTPFERAQRNRRGQGGFAMATSEGPGAIGAGHELSRGSDRGKGGGARERESRDEAPTQTSHRFVVFVVPLSARRALASSMGEGAPSCCVCAMPRLLIWLYEMKERERKRARS